MKKLDNIKGFEKYQIVWYVPLHFLCMVIDESFLDKQSYEKYISIENKNKVAVRVFNNSEYDFGIVNKRELSKLDPEFNRKMFNKSFKAVEAKYSSLIKEKKESKSKTFFTSPLIDEEKVTQESESGEEEEEKLEEEEEEVKKEENSSKRMLSKSVIPKTPIFLKEKLYDILWYKKTEKNGKLFIWPALVVDPGDLDSKTLNEYRKYENDVEKKLIPLRLFNMSKKKQYILAKKSDVLDFNVRNNNLFISNRKADANLSIAFYIAFYANGIKRSLRKSIKEEGDAGCCRCFCNDLDENENELYSLVYCDQCDLAYHWKCLNYIHIPEDIENEKVICTRCTYTPRSMKTVIRKGGQVQVLHPEEEENELSDNNNEEIISSSSSEKKKLFKMDKSDDDDDDIEEEESEEQGQEEEEDDEIENDEDDDEEEEDNEDEDDYNNEYNSQEKHNNKPHLIKPRKTVTLTDSEEEEEEKLSSLSFSEQEQNDEDEIENEEEEDDDDDEKRLRKIEKERKEIENILNGKVAYKEKVIKEKELPQKRKLNDNNNNEVNVKKQKNDSLEFIKEMDKVIIAIKTVFKRYNNYYKLQDIINNNTKYVTKPKVLAEIFTFFKYIIFREHSRDTLGKIKENIDDFENSFKQQAKEFDSELIFMEMIKRLNILINKQLDKISKNSTMTSNIYTVKWDIDMNWPCIIVAEYDLPPDVVNKYSYYLSIEDYVCIRYFCKSNKYAFAVVHSKRLFPLTLDESYKQLKKSKNEDIYDAYNAAYYANGLDLKSRLSIISIENAGCCKCFNMNRDGCEPGIDGLVDCQYCKLSYHWKCAGFEEKPDDDDVNTFICENCKSVGITYNDLPTQLYE